MWSVVGDGEQDRPGLVIDAQVDPAVVVTGVEEVEQAFGVEGGGGGQFDLGGGVLDRHDRGQPLAVSMLPVVMPE